MKVNKQHGILWSINHELKHLILESERVSSDIQFKIVDRLLSKNGIGLLDENNSLTNLLKAIKKEVEITQKESIVGDGDENKQS